MDDIEPKTPCQPDESGNHKPTKNRTKGRKQAATLDSGKCAADFLRSNCYDGETRVRFWRGEFWLWAGGGYHRAANDDIRSDLIRWLNRRWSHLSSGIVNNCIDQVKAQSNLKSTKHAPTWIDAPDSQCDWNPSDIVACRNGLIYLPNYAAVGQYFCPASPRLFCTSPLDVDFREDALEPTRWLNFLASLWGDDQSSIDLLQEWFGYCLTADTSQQKILLMVGPRRSGKGTIARVQQRLIGAGNFAGPTLASLGTQFGLQTLLEKSAAYISDARIGRRADISTIVERLLTISGEDGIDVDRKHLPAIAGARIRARFTIMTNELPRLDDASGAIPSRMLPLVMTKSWLGKEDTSLATSLYGELPGILKWSMAGWLRLKERGRFTEPAAAAELRKQLDQLSSPIRAFVEQTCVMAPEAVVPKIEIFGAYRLWCKVAGERPIVDQSEFGRQLSAAVAGIGSGQRRIAGKREHCYTAIALRASLVSLVTQECNA